ncbi:RNA polymerase sigma factor [Sulfitobacter sp. SK012]|nr:RNA polymerase sigma factor [Sulfitobacter sp. SK012]
MPQIYRRLWRFCMVLTKDRTAADDLAQAACERALVNAAKFSPGTDLDRWVFTIARRLWLNEIRSRKVRRGEGLVAVEDVDIADEKPAIEVNILAREVLDIVQALPEAQRLSVLLVYVEGYTYSEAATLLDVPIGTIMSRLSTVRKLISTYVDDPRNLK